MTRHAVVHTRSCTPTDLRAHISVPVSWPESPYPSLPCRGLLRLHTRLLKQAGTPRSSRAKGLPRGFQSNEDVPTLVVMKQSDLNSVSSTGNRGFWRRREVCNVYSPPIRSTHSPQLRRLHFFSLHNQRLIADSLAYLRARPYAS